MPDERRKLARKYLVIYSRVFDKATGLILGYLADLSATGTMLISDAPMPKGQVVALRFDLPDPESFGRNHLEVNARVAWCAPDINPAFHNLGFEFIAPGPDDLDVIEKMIIMYEFHRENPPNYPPTISSLEDVG